jgi:hypothetical protein
MTYSQKFGKFGIYADGMLYQWFKLREKAEAAWSEMTDNPEALEEWLEEYDELQLVDMTTKQPIHTITKNQ